MNIITVKINGMEYNLKGDENDEYLHMVAKYVDNRIQTLMSNNSKLTRPDATILAALNMGDELLKNKESYERLLENYKEITTDNKFFISELEKMKVSLEAFQSENVKLKEEIESSSKEFNDEELEKARLEVEKANSEMDVMKEFVNETKKENERLTALNKKLAARNRELTSSLCDKTRNIQELSKELSSRNNELIKERLKRNSLLNIKDK